MVSVINITRGSYHKLQFNIGDSQDVSGYTITFSMDNDPIAVPNPAIMKTSGSGIDMTDASTGTIYVELTEADTRALEVSTHTLEYRYDLLFEKDSKPEVWHKGMAIVENPVYLAPE